jgi:hypothetical protein
VISARLKWSAALALVATAPALGATAAIPTAGKWVRLFAPDVERVLGRSVRVDAASVATGGLGRTFREAEVMLNATANTPRGTTALSVRSVDCSGGRVVTTRWQVLGPTGSVLASSTGASGVTRIAWDSRDGKVLRYVCQGILPR